LASEALELPPEEEHRAAWQDHREGGWLAKVRPLAPALAAVIDAGTTNVHALTIPRLLRNSVHRDALQGMAVLKSGTPVESMIGLPAREEAAILAAMATLGGEPQLGSPLVGAQPHLGEYKRSGRRLLDSEWHQVPAHVYHVVDHKQTPGLPVRGPGRRSATP
jgi:hypothetical protein